MCVHFIHVFWKETALWPRCVHWCVFMCMCVCEWERESFPKHFAVLSRVSLSLCELHNNEEVHSRRKAHSEHKHTQTHTFSLILPVSLPLSSIKPHTFLSVYSSFPRESVLSCYCPRVFITSSICCPLRWCHTAQSLVRQILNCTSTVISLHTLHSKTWIQRLESYTVSPCFCWSTVKNKYTRFQ